MAPQWPVSPAWDNRPMEFIGQVRLNDFYTGLTDLELAYIFMTQPENAEDDFYDPDIISPDEGENAVIIQPYGTLPEYIHVQDHPVGPTVDDKTIWVPQITEVEETPTNEFAEIDIDKFCGIPAVLQDSEWSSNHNLYVILVWQNSFGRIGTPVLKEFIKTLIMYVLSGTNLSFYSSSIGESCRCHPFADG